MKILFVVQGEGRGHLTQAISLSQKLQDEGHQVVAVLVGKSPTRQLPDFFRQKLNAPLYSFESPNFMPTAENKQYRIISSIPSNMSRIHKYIASIRFINRKIKETEADIVVNFYELLTGLSYLFHRPKAKMICIGHQYLFLHPEFRFPKGDILSYLSLKHFTRLTAIGATKALALSFRDMPEAFRGKLKVTPPLLRKEVLDVESSVGNYLHGYILNRGFSDEIIAWHTKNPTVPLEFFWDKTDTTEVTTWDTNLTFHRLNDTKFIQYMAGSKAYATTAGFESVCEAMYLGKPILMVPAHIEQACNAYDAYLAGAGVIADTFDLDKLLLFAETYKPDNAFKYWVKQADRIILDEIRAIGEPRLARPSFATRFSFEWVISHLPGRLVRYYLLMKYFAGKHSM